LIREAIGRRIVGQESAVRGLLVSLLSGGHILIEGVPGLAKTLLARTLADAIEGSFKRIQFTPDLLPSDIVGSLVFQKNTETFVPSPGPIFANVVLADEINRAPAKVQSALLEAMEERQVSIGNEVLDLPNPFLVLATQNPLEFHGTYPLAEAQIDRFMLHVNLTYPTPTEEEEILRRADAHQGQEPVPSIGLDDLRSVQEQVDRTHVDSRAQAYIVAIISATRDPSESGIPHLSPLIAAGASPRAGIHLQSAAKACAHLEGRDFVLPEDVKTMASDVLRHRMVLSVEAHAEGITPDDTLAQILAAVPVP
jgi:MoxR-like ATPase